MMIEITNNQIPLPASYQISCYRIERQLGQGGFGITYLALDLERNRPVVIKEYFPDTLAHRPDGSTQVSILSHSKAEEYQQGLVRFKREALTLSEFRHPNIVEVLHYFEKNGTAYFIMEYIEGQSLEHLLSHQQGALSEPQIQRHCLPVLKGLAALHQTGLLHLDVKPANILYTSIGEPLLIDFGGAKYSSGRGTQVHSTMVATPGYAPPEQYVLVSEQTPATDLYAFGMTLYHLMAPQIELPGSQERQTNLLNDLPDPLPPIRQQAKGYSEQLYQAVEACSQLRQKDRPQQVTEVQQILGSLLEPVPFHHANPVVSDVAATQQITNAHRSAKPKIGYPKVALALVLLLAVSLGGYIGYQWYGDQTEPKQPELLSYAEQTKAALEQQERERQRQAELERQRQAELERQRQAELEQQRQAELERQRQAELERQRQAELERQRQAELERQRQAELERQHQAELERQRQAELERQRQAELERQRQAELERQRQAQQQSFIEPKSGIKFIKLPGGCVGSLCVHRGGSFWVSETEVTQAQWKKVMGQNKNPSRFKGDDRPVENMTWYTATEFAAKLGNGYRLLSEDEWEYAARAGSEGDYSLDQNGNEVTEANLGDYAWYDANAGRKTHPVGQKKPNKFGLYDMHGNVWEWTCSVWDRDENRADGCISNNQARSDKSRVIRGGSWNSDAFVLRAAFRNNYWRSDDDYGYLGLRLARDE